MWYKLCLDIVNKLAPVRRKRLKHPKLPPWLNKNIIQAMSDRINEFSLIIPCIQSQEMSALGILKLTQELTYKRGLFLLVVLENN